MKEIKLFIIDDGINIVYNGKIIKEKFKGSINKGRIINKEKFMESFSLVLKKEKIKNKLFGDYINIVKNSYFTVSDLFFLENIFLELGFIKVIFLDINDFFIKDNVSYIEINDTYMIINISEGIYLDLDYFKDLPKIIDYFNNNLFNDIYLFGVNKNIINIKMNNKNVYYFENYERYITDCLLKVK